MTVMPLDSEFAMFDASELRAESHAEQLRNSVSPSSHWFVLRLNCLDDDAIVKLTTVEPLPTVRSSGSRVRLPTMVIIVSPAITFLPTYAC